MSTSNKNKQSNINSNDENSSDINNSNKRTIETSTPSPLNAPSKKKVIIAQDSININDATAATSVSSDNVDGSKDNLLERAFHYYQDYSQNDDEEDIDYLLEILDILRIVDVDHRPSDNKASPANTRIKFSQVIKEITHTKDKNSLLFVKELPEEEKDEEEDKLVEIYKKKWTDTDAIISILYSMTYLQLASFIISNEQQAPAQDDTTTATLACKKNGRKEEKHIMNMDNTNDHNKGLEYLQLSLQEWKYNPASLSFLANQYRNTNSTSSSSSSATISKKQIANLYQTASLNASFARTTSIAILEDEDISEEVKQYVEALLLHSCVGSEFLDDENDDYSVVSYSEVEAIASFLSCMMFSGLGEHDLARKSLLKFGVRFRIHPTVWQTCYGDDNAATALTSSGINKQLKKESSTPPMLYRHAMNDTSSSIVQNDATTSNNQGSILPKELYNQIKCIFAPKSLFFQQSNYSQRGYYSFFIPYTTNPATTTTTVNNVMEEVIFQYLLPHVLNTPNSPLSKENLVGAEWWVHTRSKHCNLGHQLHFDTDEKSLNTSPENKKLLHPCVSSVLYVTGGDYAGPTIIMNQKATDPAEKDEKGMDVLADGLWYNKPKNNTFLTFDGDLLHGALPCNTSSSSSKVLTDETDEHRLTIMVGFWTDPSISSLASTDNATKSEDEDEEDEYMYQPSNPNLPSIDDEEHTWVKQIITSDYPKTIPPPSPTTTPKTTKPIPCNCIQPAWEQIITSDPKSEDENDDEDYNKYGYPLIIPKIMDHRFFIRNENTFYQSLFEEKECMDEDDDTHEAEMEE